MLDISQFMGPMGGLLCLAFAMGWIANGRIMQKSVDEKSAELDAMRAAKDAIELEQKQRLLDEVRELREFMRNQTNA